MTEDERQRLTDIWKQKTDEELIIISRDFSNCSADAEEIIRGELRRRGIPEPDPNIGTIGGPQNSQTSNRIPVRATPNAIPTNWAQIAAIGVVLGIVTLMVGIGMIQISPNLVYQQQGEAISIGGYRTTERYIETVTAYSDLAYLGGILFVFVGVVGTAVSGLSFFAKTLKPSSLSVHHHPPTPTSAKIIELGDTQDKVQRVMGQPEKIVNLGPRVTHIYKDMKIIYIDGKVSDVQV